MADESFLRDRLRARQQQNALRRLTSNSGRIDFCSNDYLGFARAPELRRTIEERAGASPEMWSGSTGSRLISGHSELCEHLERELAAFHQAPAGLIFNSGYDANLGLFSSLPQRGDTVLYDELVHASIRDGIRLGFARAYAFGHNDISDLERKLQRARGEKFVAVESVYSMDGDSPPLAALAALCDRYGAHLIVDEAHATGVFGPHGAGRVVEFGLQENVLARVHTFGKALGVHGAIVLGSETVRTSLINFARSFIYTTFLPPHSLLAIAAAYDCLRRSQATVETLWQRIALFRRLTGTALRERLLPGDSPIQAVLCPGNDTARRLAARLQASGFDVRAILAPTVPAGKERLRICLHAFNQERDIEALVEHLNAWCESMSKST